MLNTSIIHGAVPVLLMLVASFAALLGYCTMPPAFWRRRWWVVGVVAVVGAWALAAWIHSIPGLINDATDEYPSTINVIAALAFGLLAVLGLGWRVASRRHRALHALGAVLLLVLAADRAAVHYEYPRDLRTLFGLPAAGSKPFNAADFQPAPTGPPAGTPASAPGRSTGSSAPSAPGGPMRPPPGPLPPTGQLLSDVPIPGTTSGFRPRTAYVWLPPAYFATPRPSLPVVVLLSGVPGQPSNYPAGLDADAIFERAAAAHRGLAPIVIMADHNGEIHADRGCIDSPAAKIETYLAVDVPAFARRTFGAAGGPQSTAIGGFSDGATCALMVGLRHPDVYGPIIALSPDATPNLHGKPDEYIATFLHGDRAAMAEHSPWNLLVKGTTGPATTVLLEAGTGEQFKLHMAEQLARAGREGGIPIQLRTHPGKHDFAQWQTALADAFPWVTATLLRSA